MATVNNDNIVKGSVSGQGFLMHVDMKINHASFPLHQGDLVFFNAGIAKPVTADADCAALLGVALQPSGVSSNLDNSSAPAEKTIQVGFGVVALFNSTGVETYTDGLAVYLGADAQTITTVVGTNKVGVVKLAPSVASITGAAGVKVPVLVYSHALVAYAA